MAPPPTISASGSKVLTISSKKSPEGVGLYAEDIDAHGVAFLGEAADQLGGLVHVAQAAQIVAGIARQEIRQERTLDGGEGAHRFEASGAAAVAFGIEALDGRDALVGNQHVAEFAAETLAALDDVAVHDDAAAEAGADNGGDAKCRGYCRRKW